MARRRGFFAEMQHQAQQAERRRQQQAVAAYRTQVSTQRAADQARAAADRARIAAARASDRERAQLEREAARLHLESQQAEVESRNASLAHTLEEIDGILAATLDVDDYVDLEALKITKVDHPPFEPGQLGIATPEVPALVYTPEPVYDEPKQQGMIGAKKRHEAAVVQARADYDRARFEWHQHNTGLYEAYKSQVDQRDQAEQERLGKLAEAYAHYEAECRQREAEAEAGNQELSKLITGLAFDVESAIQEYVSIVLSNSAYPDAFPVVHEHEFDLSTRELRLQVTVPAPTALPAVKEYKYVKAKDEISATPLTLKGQKDRYASAVCQVALRTLHEVFEADRGGKIHSIALTVATNTVSPATGLPESVPLVSVAAGRDTFAGFDLTNVVPSATLEHLGAAISRSPFDLVPADMSRGVRARKQ